MNRKKSIPASPLSGTNGKPAKNAVTEDAFKAALLHTIGLAIIATDTDGTVTYWNGAATVLYGWTAEEAMGKNILALTPADSSRKQAEDIMATLVRGQSFSGDFVVKRKDGSYFTAHVTDTPVINAAGELTGIIGISSDVTAIRTREAEMAMLLDNTDESFILLDRDLYIRSFNRACAVAYKSLTGKEVVKGTSIFQYSRPERTDALRKNYAAVLEGETQAHEIMFTPKPGDTRYFSLAYKPVRDENGNITGVFVSSLDITALKASAERLKVSEKRFRALAENSKDAVVLNDESGRSFYASPSITRVTGYTEDEVLNKKITEFIHPDDGPNINNALQACYQLPGQALEPVRMRIKNKNGEYDWLESTVTNLLNDPAVSGIVVNIRNISDQVRVEQSLEKQRAILAEAEANYREIFQKGSDAIIVHDIETGAIVDMNDKAGLLLGMDMGAGKTNPPGLFDKAQQAFNTPGVRARIRKAAKGSPQVFEQQVVNARGEIHWVEVSVTPASIAGQDRVLAFIRDIEKRKKSEAEKAATERDKAALINSTDDLIWSVDEDLNLVAANSCFIASIFKTTGVVIRPGDSVLMREKFPAEWLKRWKEFYARALTGESFTEELFTPSSIGQSESWSEIRFTPITDELKKVTGIACYFRDVTERKLAATRVKEMAKQSRLFESIVNSSGDAILSTDTDGIITSWNLGAEKIFGYSAGEMTGKPLSRVINTNNRGQADDRALYKAPEKGVKTFDAEYRAKNGSLIYLSVSVSPITSTEGTVAGSSVIARDITERKIAREKIAQSEARLATAQQVAKVGSWETDLQTLQVTWSDETFRIFELDPGKFQVSHPGFLDYVHPVDRVRVDSALKTSFDNSGSNAIEHRIITPAGTEKFVEERWMITRDATGKAVRAIGTCQDITDRKSAEQSNEFKVKLLNTIGQATIATDRYGMITYWNQAAEEIYGWAAIEAMRYNLLRLLPADGHQTAWKAALEQIQNGSSWEGELLAKRNSEQVFPIFITMSPVFDHNSNVNGIIAVSTDITARKETEQRILLNEHQLSVIYNSVNDCLFLLSVNSNDRFLFISANQQCFETLGVAPGQLLGKEASAIIPAENWPGVLARYKKAISTAATVEWEERNYTATGVKVGRASITPVFDDSGNCIRLVGSITDITQRIEAEEAIRQSEKRYRSLYEQSLAGVYQSTFSGKVVDCNQAFAEMLHYDSVEALLLNQDDLYFSRDERSSFLQSVAEGLQTQNHEGMMKRRDGSPLFFIESLTVSRDNRSGEKKIDGILLDITAKKENELALRQSNERYINIGKATNDAVWEWDILSGEVTWGGSFESIFGLPAEQLKSYDSWELLLKPSDRNRIRESITGALRQPGIFLWKDEYAFQKSDGSYAVISDKGFIMRDDSGKACKMVGAMQDVTRQRKEEAHSKLLESVITNTHDSVLITAAEPLDHPGPAIIYCNAAFTRMTGYTLTELIGQTPRILQGPESDFDELKKLGETLRRWKPASLTTINYKKDGKPFWIYFSVSPVADEKGWVTHWISIERDVTGQKQAEEALRLSNDRYNLVTRATNDIIWDWNLLTGEVTRSMQNMEKVFGYTVDPSIERIGFWMDHVHPEDRPGIEAEFELRFADPNEHLMEREYRFQRADGTYADVYDKGFILRDAHQKPVRMIGAVQDISNLKEKERLLEKRADELTLSNRELEQFAYVASHDLQEPLRMVTGFLTQLQKKYDSKLDADARKYIHFAVDGAKRMRQIILDLLEYSRINRQEHEKEDVDLNVVIDEILVLYQQQIQEKQARLQVNRLPVVKGNKSPLRQLFQNLIANALTFTRPGVDPAITVSAVDQDTHWHFVVADNGIGISSEYYEKIFVIFQRLHAKGVYPGTGMGLAIARKIVETMDGNIWVSAEEGKGSRFYFTLKKQI